MEKKTQLALRISKYIHDTCDNVPHDIGLKIVDIMETEFNLRIEEEPVPEPVLKVGSVLVAKMDFKSIDGETFLLKGKEYPVDGFNRSEDFDELYLKSETSKTHLFDLNELHHAYWGKYFTKKAE